MNVLFVTYDFPYPTNSGGKNRAYHLLKHTAKNANVFLFSFVRSDYSSDFNKEIFSLNVKDIKIFKRKKLLSFTSLVKSIIPSSSIFKTLYFDPFVEEEMIRYIKEHNIDVVHFESSYTGYYIAGKLKKLNVRKVLGTENIEFMLYHDLARSSRKFYLKPLIYIQANSLKNEELEMIKEADQVTVITNSEAKILNEMTGVKCNIVGNGIEQKEYLYKFDSRKKNNILFVGNFSYFPNVDAMDFFIKEVFPKLPNELTLTIIGKNGSKVIKSDDRRIIKKDFVEDIITEYRKADILVFPIKIGGGTNFKILEAMSLGLPIVANPDRLSGLNAIEGEHFLKAATGEEYREQILKLYDDTKLREKLALNARKLIDKNYSWENIGHELVKVWRME